MTRKYTESEIIDIRTSYDDGVSQSTLADEYDVSQSFISRIVRGLDYNDVGGPVSCRQIKKLSDEDIDKIRQQRWDGDELEEIADEWDIHPAYAGKITRFEVRQ